MSIRAKTFSGLLWTFAEQFGNRLIQFVIGIILARLLLPEEFGLIGMITIFIAISEVLVSSGFNQALIRKKDCTTDDYNTAFIVNTGLSVFLYLLIYISAQFIADFYEKDELIWLVRVLCTVILFDAISFTQRARLFKSLNFKLIAKASVISQFISSAIGIMAAYSGYGVWSLVIKMVLNRLIMSINLILINKWIPQLKFSLLSFRELFAFGSKIMVTQLIDRAYQNIYLVVIGKYFSAGDLGYYTRANLFKSMVSEQLVSSVQVVTLPALANIQENQTRLINGFKSLSKLVIFISSFFLIGLVAISGPMILFLIGEKWQESIIYLQLLAISAIFYPVGEINLNVLQVKGRSDLLLKLQIIKKMFSIPLIIVGVMIGIKYLIIGIIISSIFDFFANSFYSKRMIDYSSFSQLANSLPSMLIMTVISFLTYLISILLNEIPVGLIFLIQIVFYGSISIIVFEIIKKAEYIELKNILMDFIRKFLARNKKTISSETP